MQELETLIALATQAGRIAREIRDKGFSVVDKGGGLGPVTDADRAASDYLMAELGRRFPDDLVVSEEAEPPAATSARRIWYVDPIDGTKEFIRGDTDWTVMVGAAADGVPSIGVVHRPLTGETYFASRGRGAWLRSQGTHGTPDRRLSVRGITHPSNATIVFSRSHRSKRAARASERLGITRSFEMGSVGLKLSMIARGEADLYFNFSGMPNLWDLCAAEIILDEAGGRLLRLDPDDWASRVPYSLDKLQVGVPFFGAAGGIAEGVAERLRHAKL